MTNEKRIKQLNTWELAEFIFNVSNNATQITICKDECAKCKYSDGSCISGIYEWLNRDEII